MRDRLELVTVRLAWAAEKDFRLSKRLPLMLGAEAASRFRISVQEGARCVMVTGLRADLHHLAIAFEPVAAQTASAKLSRSARLIAERIRQRLAETPRNPLAFDHSGESPAYFATRDVPALRARNRDAGAIIPAAALVFFTIDLLPNDEPTVTLQYVNGDPTEPGGHVIFRNTAAAEKFIALAGLEIAPDQTPRYP